MNDNAAEQSLVADLREAEGTPKACILTEPLWGIPFNLYTPYMSVYMIALGCSDTQIGFIATVGLVLQGFFSFLSGAITDKMGRKKTTFIFDTLSWSIPALLWMFAQNFYWFLIAAIINSMLRITMNSWTCLFIEDVEEKKLVSYWTWIFIAGIVSGFVSPLTGLFIERFQLIPTMRAIFFLTFLLMTVKFIVLNVYATETRRGIIRMEETKHQSLLKILSGYKGVLKQVLNDRKTIIAFLAMIIFLIYKTVFNAFWPVLMTKGLGFTSHELGWFPAVRSAIILAAYFLLLPRLQGKGYKTPLLIAFSCLSVSVIGLIVSPERSFLVIIGVMMIEGVGLAVANPYLQALMAASVPPEERARILAWVNVFIIVITSPFGWISGSLSEINKTYPFILLAFFLIAAVVIMALKKPLHSQKS